MSNDVKENLLSVDQWLRILFIAIFAFVCWVLIFVVGVLVIGQVLISLFTGSDNLNLRMLGNGLSQYIKQILQYMTYNSDTRPFPFSPFPDMSVDGQDSPQGADYETEYEAQYEASSYGYEEVSQPEDRAEDKTPAQPDPVGDSGQPAGVPEKAAGTSSTVADPEPDFNLDEDEDKQVGASDEPRDIDPEPVRTAPVDIDEDDDDVFADISFTRSAEPPEEDEDDEIPDLILDDDETDKDKGKS